MQLFQSQTHAEDTLDAIAQEVRDVQYQQIANKADSM